MLTKIYKYDTMVIVSKGNKKIQKGDGKRKMVTKKLKLVCFDLVCRLPCSENLRTESNIKIIGGKKDAFKQENHIPYLKDGEIGYPINIHFEKWQFEMNETKFMKLADTKTKIEKEKEI